MNDRELDDRVRASLDDLADAAGGPPPWPADATARAGSESPTMWLRLGAVAAVLALVIGGLALLTGRDRVDVVDAPDGSEPLFGTRWYLSAATVGGEAISTSPEAWVFGEGRDCGEGPPLCLDGPMLLGRDGCNQFTRGVDVGRDRIMWGEPGMSTQAGCPDADLPAAFVRIKGGDGFDWRIEGDVLTIRENGVVMTFEAGHPLGPPTNEVLDKGRVGDIAYRVNWHSGVSIEWVDTTTASMASQQGYAAMGDTLSATFVDLGPQFYLLAIVPDATSEAHYVTDDGTVFPLTLLRDRPILAARALLDTDPGPGSLVATDDAGAVLASVSMIGVRQRGITSIEPVPPTTAPGLIEGSEPP